MSQDYVVHVLGRVYLCPQEHETDDVPAPSELTEAFLNDPPDTAPCSTCGEPATLKYYGERHLKSAPCQHPRCVQAAT